MKRRVLLLSVLWLLLCTAGCNRSTLSMSLTSATIDARGHLWLVGTTGAVEWDPDTQTYAHYLADKQILSIATDATGSVWLGTWGQGLYRFGNASWDTYDIGWIASITIAPDGSVWVGTDEGVSHFDGQNWISYTAQDGLALAPDMFISTIVVSPDGTAWFSTNQGRVSSFDGTTWQSWPDYTSPMTMAPDGAVWLTQRAGGVARYDEKMWTAYPDYLLPLVANPAGTIWLVRAAGGVARYDGQTWAKYTQANGLASNTVENMLTAPDGSLWVYDGAEGLSHFDGGIWTAYPFAQLGRPQQTLSIHQTGSAYSVLNFAQLGPDGRLWIASQNGRELRIACYELPKQRGALGGNDSGGIG